MDSLIILKLLPLYLFIDSVLSVNPWARGGAFLFTITFSLVPERIFQISGLKPRSKLQVCSKEVQNDFEFHASRFFSSFLLRTKALVGSLQSRVCCLNTIL